MAAIPKNTQINWFWGDFWGSSFLSGTWTCFWFPIDFYSLLTLINLTPNIEEWKEILKGLKVFEERPIFELAR